MKKFINFSMFMTLLFLPIIVIGQNNDSGKLTSKVYRLNFLNPGFEIEFPVSSRFTFSANAGVGYGGAYPNLTRADNGFVYIISPFIDLQFKRFYNLEKRLDSGKSIKNNSGNFLSARLLWRGSSIDDNVIRSTQNDFSFSATWGIQRNYGKFHLLFDLGPEIYWDTEGTSGFFPINPQINIGIDLN